MSEEKENQSPYKKPPQRQRYNAGGQRIIFFSKTILPDDPIKLFRIALSEFISKRNLTEEVVQRHITNIKAGGQKLYWDYFWELNQKKLSRSTYAPPVSPSTILLRKLKASQLYSKYSAKEFKGVLIFNTDTEEHFIYKSIKEASVAHNVTMGNLRSNANNQFLFRKIYGTIIND